VKRLLDENLSDRILARILDLYADSAHVKQLGLTRTDDAVIWDHAGQNGYTIVSKDSDFHQRSLAYGHPPKFIYLRVGNCPTSRITLLLRTKHQTILSFKSDPDASILVLA
jgi:predicted nuclease of predicted toxin-antitoxin system